MTNAQIILQMYLFWGSTCNAKPYWFYGRLELPGELMDEDIPLPHDSELIGLGGTGKTACLLS